METYQISETASYCCGFRRAENKQYQNLWDSKRSMPQFFQKPVEVRLFNKFVPINWSYPYTGLDRPLEFHKNEAPSRRMNVVTFSAIRTGSLGLSISK
jgi:hypothetical protein